MPDSAADSVVSLPIQSGNSLGGNAYASRIIAAMLDGDPRRVRRLLEELLRARDRDSRQTRQWQLAALLDLLDAMHSLSLTDELTGLHNRRGFLQSSVSLLERAVRDECSALLLFVDVDGLKRVNDCEGHLAGDALLKKAAQVLRQTFRNDEVVGRLGGDEFAVLVRPIDGDDEQSIVDRLKFAVEACNSSVARPPLSLSIGFARFNPHAPLPITALLDQADRAMCRDKLMKRHRLGRVSAVDAQAEFEADLRASMPGFPARP